MGSAVDDFARLVQRIRDETGNREILRLVLHPKDFNAIQREAAFVSGPAAATQVACRGHLWGVPIHVDPRNEENIAYVVTRDDDRSKGKPYQIAVPGPRRTAWARVLSDDLIGVDQPGECQDDDPYP